MRIDWRRRDVLVLDDVFDETELEVLTSVADRGMFEAQELGRGMTPSRSRERAQVESAEVANILWWHLAEHVRPLSRWFEGRHDSIRVYPGLEDWVPYACNERSRLYRYGLGADFRGHEDEAWRPKRNVRSFLTVLVCLPTEEPCVGGETVIDGEVVAAEPGRVVVFPHDLLHEGRPVESGHKLVLRNDIVGVGVSESSVEHWRDADLSAAQVAAVADAAGWRDFDVVRLLIREFEHVGVGDANAILLRLRGTDYRAERASMMTQVDYVLSLPADAPESELGEFERRTGFGKKLSALADAGRHGDVDVALERLLPDEVGVRELTVDEARALAVTEIAEWGVEMVVLDEHTEEHDFGWSFAAQTRSFAESRNPMDMAIGHGAVIVDRFTSAVWVTGSNQLNWLETYRLTGNPRLNL